MMQRTLIILKPDCLQRNLLGEIIKRFENKGLKIAGLKMGKISDEQIIEHYSQHKDKPFFGNLQKFMQSAPVIFIVLEGYEAVESIRVIVGPTLGRKADAGSIRGDYSMSQANNIVHASDSPENAEIEIKRFFQPHELFDYYKDDWRWVYHEDERPA
ncbi:MAG: nucleoside-diphosphate kinase [Candidatus Komeilibacteria bacterium]|nr:nucleoside-diphosphate kinase [Candidatus Komeilibacteria bacterium]